MHAGDDAHAAGAGGQAGQRPRGGLKANFPNHEPEIKDSFFVGARR